MRPILPRLLLGVPLWVVACDEVRLQENPDLPGSVIVGVITSEAVESPGASVVLLSDGDNPMPPEGVGFPISFSGAAPAAWQPKAEGAMGATFAFNGLEPGSYALSAIMDNDGNFHPEVSPLATPTCGDRVGWHRETPAGGGSVQAITLGADTRLDNILVGPLEEVTEPNPVFTIEGDRTFVPGGTYRIEARGLNVEFGDKLQKLVSGPLEADDPCRAGFRYIELDRDGDGDVDSLPILPLPLLDDAWPIFTFEYLGTPVDTLGDGVPDDFQRSDPFPDDLYVAVATSTPYVPDGSGGYRLANDSEIPPPNVGLDTPILQAELTALAFRIDGEGNLNITEVGDLPSGAYSVRLISQQGQLWSVPNEIDSRLARSRDLPPPGLTAGAAGHQGVWLTKP